MERKELLSYDDLIAKLKKLGISFRITKEDEAKTILKNNNYFFKLGAFRKNFEKKNDRYTIDFAHLSDLAKIDMQLRYVCLHMCLDVEHTVKCLILDHITEKEDEDGYKIMQNYFSDFTDQKNYIFHHRIRNSKLFKKYYNDPPVWVCLELMDFGALSKFIEYYIKKLTLEERQTFPLDLKLTKYSLFSAKNVRNKCAHNSPLILNIRYEEDFETPNPLYNEGLTKYNLTRTQMKNPTTTDLLGLFLLHNLYCNESLKEKRNITLKEWLQRSEKYKKTYGKHTDLSRFFSSIRKLINNIELTS